MAYKFATALIWATMACMGSAQLENPIYKDDVVTNEVEDHIDQELALDPWLRTCVYTSPKTLFTYRAEETYVYKDNEIEIFQRAYIHIPDSE